MIKKRQCFTLCNYLFSKPPKRPLSSTPSSSALPVDPSFSSSSSLNDHKSICFSLVDGLIYHGLLASAQQVIQRIIVSSPSLSDAIDMVDFVCVRGVELDRGICSAFIRKLVESGEPTLARYFFNDYVVSKGIVPDSNILNSMVICLAKLGEFDEAVRMFDRLTGNDNLRPCKAACKAVVRGFLDHDRIFEAVDWLVTISNADVRLDICSYTVLITGLCDKGYMDEAIKVFDIMQYRSKAACKAVVRGFLDQDRIFEAVDWLVTISNAYVRLDMCSYTVLITGLCDKGYMDEAIKVFDIMQYRSGLVSTLRLLKSLFYGLCKKGRAPEAELFLEKIEKRGFYIDKVMYTSLMNAYWKDKEMKMAMRVFSKMLKRGWQPDIYSYNTLIHGFAKMGMLDKGRGLFSLVIQLGMQPNVVTYNIMISNYCRQGEIECAERLWDAMIRDNLCPSVHCYTSLLAFFYKENKFYMVVKWLEKMLDSGVVPDNVSFFILLKNKEFNKLQLSLIMLRQIAKHGCGLDSSTLLPFSSNTDPTLDSEQEIELLLEEISRSDLNLGNVAVGIYITALCEIGKIDEAIACFRKYGSLSLFIINSLIKRLFQDERFKDAKSLFDTTIGCGIVPNLATYNIMVNGYCQHGEMDALDYIFCDMKKRGMKPDVAIYSSIISCLSRERKLWEAEEMLLSVVDADETMYMTIVNAYFRNGSSLKASQLFNRMKKMAIKPSLYSYTTLIIGLVKKGMIDECCSYLDEMLSVGIVPDAKFYTLLINHFLRRGELVFALRLVDLMDSNQCDLTFYIVLASGICRYISRINQTLCEANRISKKQKEKLLGVLPQRPMLSSEYNLTANTPETRRNYALRLLPKLEEISFMPDLYLYNIIISGYSWANMMEDAYKHVKLMQKKGIRPNEVTFTILMDAHGRAGEIDDAVGLFNKMNECGCTPDKIAYMTLLKGICMAGRGLDAVSLLYAMQKRGFFPGKVSYENLLHCLCACSLSIPSFRIFEEMIARDYVPRQYFTSRLLFILCKEKKLYEAHKVRDMLHERGRAPSYCTLRLLEETSYKQRASAHIT